VQSPFPKISECQKRKVKHAGQILPRKTLTIPKPLWRVAATCDNLPDTRNPVNLMRIAIVLAAMVLMGVMNRRVSTPVLAQAIVTSLPQFDVASIKPADPSDYPGRMGAEITNLDLHMDKIAEAAVESAGTPPSLASLFQATVNSMEEQLGLKLTNKSPGGCGCY
jgi:hypothetical protein